MRKTRGNAMFVVNHLGCNFFPNAKEKDRPKPVFPSANFFTNAEIPPMISLF